MVAAQWGETRGSDARTGGGVSGRFRLLGGSAEAPDTTPPPFGTAPWGYRRSEVDAWASWVAGLVAHGRNETIRADSAEATLKATLDRLEQLERPSSPDAQPPDAATVSPLPMRPGHDEVDESGPAGDAITPDSVAPDAGAADAVTADPAMPDAAAGEADAATQGAGEADPVTSAAVTPNPATPDAVPPGARAADAVLAESGDRDADTAQAQGTHQPSTHTSAGPAARTAGRLHFDTPADLPRRRARGVGAAPAPAPGTTSRTATTAGTEAPASGTEAHDTGAAARSGTTADGRPRDHDLARLHVVETTLHEVLGLLHQLADRDRGTTGS